MYKEKAEAISLKLERNKERLNYIQEKIIKLKLDEEILKKKIMNQETYLRNIQVKVEEEGRMLLDTLGEQIAEIF